MRSQTHRGNLDYTGRLYLGGVVGTKTDTSGRTLVLEEEALRARLRDVRANIARLQVVERQLITALGFFDTDLLAAEDVQLEELSAGPTRTMPKKRRALRQRAMISAVLHEAPTSGRLMAIKDIIAAIAQRYGVTLVRTSVSPTLRKMEQAGAVEHIGSRWQWKPNASAP